jgi:hypothetical protein
MVMITQMEATVQLTSQQPLDQKRSKAWVYLTWRNLEELFSSDGYGMNGCMSPSLGWDLTFLATRPTDFYSMHQPLSRLAMARISASGTTVGSRGRCPQA